MAFCPQCGTQLKGKARFCTQCGAECANTPSDTPQGGQHYSSDHTFRAGNTASSGFGAGFGCTTGVIAALVGIPIVLLILVGLFSQC